MKQSPILQTGKHCRFWLLALIVLVFTTVLILLFLFHQVVIFGPPAGTGDPGNRRLHELSNDSVFASLPPNAHLRGPITQTPASYRQPAFQTGGWDGPSVVVTFVSDQPASTIYQFYAQRAAEAGWHAISQGALGYTDTWTKTYSDNATGYLSLLDLGNSPNGHIYKFSGSTSVLT